MPPYHFPIYKGSGTEATEAIGGGGAGGYRDRLQGILPDPEDGDLLLIPWSDPY